MTQLTDKEKVEILWSVLCDEGYWTHARNTIKGPYLGLVETSCDGNLGENAIDFLAPTLDELLAQIRAWQMEQRLTK